MFGCFEIDVPYIGFVGYSKQYITEYAIVSEHILTFKIASVAPSTDKYKHFIGAFPYK